MRCGSAREWLSLAMDGQLPPDRTISLEKHLQQCAECHSYREDLQVGQRLLRATEPQLSENFEWRLQLKLNQTLREAARTAVLPWETRPTGLRRWFGSVGLATAGSLAAVLLVGLLVLPPSGRLSPADSPGGSSFVSSEVPATPETGTIGGDRGRIDDLPNYLDGAGRLVNTGTTNGGRSYHRPTMPSPWSGFPGNDLRTITNLRAENRLLRKALYQTQHELTTLKALLDSEPPDQLDHLPEEE